MKQGVRQTNLVFSAGIIQSMSYLKVGFSRQNDSMSHNERIYCVVFHLSQTAYSSFKSRDLPWASSTGFRERSLIVCVKYT